MFSEVADYQKPLITTGLTFPRLIDDVVLPYQENSPFFIDGVPLTRDNIKRLKIIRQAEEFNKFFADLHWRVRTGSEKKLFAEQYHIRFEALLREFGEDVTSQIIKAYDQKIKPSIKDYLPKREELTKAAMQFFLEAIKVLGNT